MSKELNFTKNEQIKHLNSLNGYKSKGNTKVINLLQNINNVDRTDKSSNSYKRNNAFVIIISIVLLCMIAFPLLIYFYF